MPSTGFAQEVTVRLHMPYSLTESMSLLRKVKSGMESPDWHVPNLTFTSENSCECNAQEMPERTEMTKQIDWREVPPSQVVCVSADLKC